MNYWKHEVCSQTVLPDRSLFWLVDNAKIQMRQFEWFSNNVCHWKTEQWLFWLLFQRLKMEMRKLMIDRNTFKCQLSILLTPGYLLRRDRCRLKFTHLTWIGLKIGTSTRGLSRWLRGRGWQVPHAGEFTSPTRGRRAWWRKVPRAARATLHRRKWLIHVGRRRRTSCKERFTCEKPHLLTHYLSEEYRTARANFHLYRKTIICLIVKSKRCSTLPTRLLDRCQLQYKV